MTGKRTTTKAAGQRKSSTTRKRPNELARAVAPLVERVVAIIEEAQSRVVRSVNSTMVLTYWHIGREIVEFVQGGSARAEYGEQVVADLSRQLQASIGRGYSATNLRNFRLFYLQYRERRPELSGGSSDKSEGIRQTQPGKSGRARIRQTPSGEFGVQEGFSASLSWSHYQALCKVESAATRTFYEIEAERERWSVRDLERQIHTQLHLRLLKSRNKEGVIDLVRRGQVIERPIDLMKSPVVLDFLDLPESEVLRESDLESAILSKLSQFLLELGKGFAFVARQKRLTFEDEEFYVDLVFYNILLKCYLLIDLKLGKLAHQDVGQMDSYVRLFDVQGRTDSDGPTIGLILCAQKNEAIAKYSVLSEHKQLFAAKYVTHLPSVEELERELRQERRLAESLADAPFAAKATRKKRLPRTKARA
jgi:predicted nuclease of restriction endonuclease-like (RecB) superfamily